VKDIGFWPVIAYNGFHMSLGEEKGGGNQEDRFLKAFDEYADALFRHATYRLSDRERAVEIVHDTFTKVWSYIRSGHTVDSYKPFLYKILNNLIIDEYRKRKSVSLDGLMSEEGIDEGNFDELHEGSLEEMTFALDAKQALEMMGDIPDMYREVLTLRFVDGLGPKEISDLVEESENVVSVRIHRGIKILKERIETAEEMARIRRTSPYYCGEAK